MNTVSELLLRDKIPAIAIMVAAVVWSLGEIEKAPKLLSNPLELRSNNRALSLTLHAGVASDGRNSFYLFRT